MIYYAITPSFSTVTRYVDEGNYDAVYDRVMIITDNNDEISTEASWWCSAASVGEKYKHELFTIEVIEDSEN